MLGFLPEHLRTPVLIGVPLVALVIGVWVWNLSSVFGDPPAPPVLSPEEAAKGLEAADIEFLSNLDSRGLAAEIAQRQDALQMAKHDGNEAAIAERELLLKRAKDIQQSMGK